jgi:nicotinate-nucleotide adenylyltransferase
MPKQIIAVGGSAANPPHLGHLALIQTILQSHNFTKVMWIPSGIRPDKPDFVHPMHRLAMTELTLKKIQDKRFILNPSDVFGKNMPTIDWMEILQEQNPQAEIVWYTGIDSVVPQEKYGGLCEIEARWQQVEKLIKGYKFLIISRVGYPRPASFKIPLENYEILDVELPDISSSDIREQVASGNTEFEKLVTPEVADYIKVNKLYGWKGAK